MARQRTGRPSPPHLGPELELAREERRLAAEALDTVLFIITLGIGRLLGLERALTPRPSLRRLAGGEQGIIDDPHRVHQFVEERVRTDRDGAFGRECRRPQPLPPRGPDVSLGVE